MKEVRIIITIGMLVLLLVPVRVLCADNPDDTYEEGISDEIRRQIDGLDLSDWDEYISGITDVTEGDLKSIDEFIAACSDGGYGDGTQSFFDRIAALLKLKLRECVGFAAKITAAALLTTLAGIAADDGLKETLSAILCLSAVTLTVGLLTSLAAESFDSVRETAELTEKTAPIVSAVMISSGSSSAAGIFRPLFMFLSETVLAVIYRAALPLVLAGGVLNIADVFTDRVSLKELSAFASKAVKWILGLMSVFYSGATALYGLTAGAKDGVMLRTAKYAVDKLVPAAGGMLGGTLDSVLGCSLMIRNGVGTAAVLILFSRILRPLLAILAGMTVFRAAAALSAPAADPRVVKLLSSAADTASGLFACTAVCGALFLLTVLAAIASGGITAGLW